MPYLDMDTVLMSQPLYEFCDSIRKSEENSNRFWEQIDRSFLLGIPASKMRFIPDECPGFTECVVVWGYRDEQTRYYELISPIEIMSDSMTEATGEDVFALKQVKQFGITDVAMGQDVSLAEERPVVIPGTTVFRYLPVPKNTIVREALNFMEEQIKEGITKKESATGKTNGIEFDVLVGFIVTHFLLKYGPDNFDVEERVVERKPIHAKQVKKARKAPMVRTYKTYTLVKEFDFTDRNPIVRQCRLWLVRGHDRHYKDGKVVHIDPYYKGVDRDTVDKDNPPPTGRFVKVKPLKLEPQRRQDEC